MVAVPLIAAAGVKFSGASVTHDESDIAKPDLRPFGSCAMRLGL